jgi:hypothetical protein
MVETDNRGHKLSLLSYIMYRDAVTEGILCSRMNKARNFVFPIVTPLYFKKKTLAFIHTEIHTHRENEDK